LTRWQADAALAATALLWGVAFVAQKEAESFIPPVSFVAARFAISAVALAPFAAIESRRAVQELDARSWRLAVAIALTLFTGSVLQQIGLATTSATNGGFLTACYVALTPLAVWLLTGRPPRKVVAVACALSVAGAWLLATGGGPAQPLSIGDGLIIVSDFAWAFGIAWTPMFLARRPRPFTLAFLQYVVCAALSVVLAVTFETARAENFVAGIVPLLYAGLISGGVAFTLQIVAQRYTPPSQAAVILSLESVFAAIAAAILIAERLTVVAAAGSALILISVLIVELGPPALTRLRAGALFSTGALPVSSRHAPVQQNSSHKDARPRAL
jgi:drug/metabolite transporter (DMT)-like permease